VVKLKDIARELKLSTSTVSRVVNNQDRVDPETRQRVMAALKRHNYQPDENARRLKTNSSNVIGVIVPDIANPFFAQVIKGIEKGLAPARHPLLLCNTDESREREVEAVQLFRRQKVAGIIVATSLEQRQIRKTYAAAGCPVVFFDNVPHDLEPVRAVSIDNARAACELVRYLVSQGHRRVFLIGGPLGESSADAREQGWRQALAEAGIEPRADWLWHGNFQESSGEAAMNRFLAREELPTAICAANNFMAYGAVKAIEARGLSIPEDLSLAAFDAIDPSGLMRLSLTSILQPAEAIGQVAADLCLAAQKPNAPNVSQRVILEHAFFAGRSVRALNGRA